MKTGRPRLNSEGTAIVTGFTLTHAHIEKINEICRGTGLNRSEVVRKAIDQLRITKKFVEVMTIEGDE